MSQKHLLPEDDCYLLLKRRISMSNNLLPFLKTRNKKHPFASCTVWIPSSGVVWPWMLLQEFCQALRQNCRWGHRSTVSLQPTQDGWMNEWWMMWLRSSSELMWTLLRGCFECIMMEFSFGFMFFFQNWWSILICWDDFLDECWMILGERWWDGSDNFSVFWGERCRELFFFCSEWFRVGLNCFRRSHTYL